MDSAYQTLEFQKVKEIILPLSSTERGKELVEGLAILDLATLTQELSYTQEALDLLSRYGGFPIDGSKDLRSVLDYAEKGGVLTPAEFLAILEDLKTVHLLKEYFKKVEMSPILLEYQEGIVEIPALLERIADTVGPDLEIKDEASPTLRAIRLKRKRLERKILESLTTLIHKYQPYLNGSSFAYKNGHYALPVNNVYKAKVGGLVQDVSGSGETLFVEPEELLRIQNEILMNEQEEKEEIARILIALTGIVKTDKEFLLENNDRIAYLDFLLAKARFGEMYHGHIAHLSKKKEIAIYGARHPLLDQRKAVPNDFVLNSDEPIMIISGPNAGGKTVALKTIGLLVILFEAGLPIPAKDGAEIAYCPHVYADIGDGQSISDSLSTFAAHITKVAGVLNAAEENDLVLFDEIGTGTSPQEGEALAYASIKELLKIGCFALVSSHFNGLKAFALKEKRLASASMLFDESKLLPTYRLKRGLPGESYAFEVAARYGLKETVVEEAKAFLGMEKGSEQSALSRRLLDLTLKEEQLEADLKEQRRLLIEERNKLEKEREAIKKKEENLEEIAKQKEAKLLDKTRKEVSELISILSKPDLKLHEAIEAKKKLDSLSEEQEEETSFSNEKIMVGDYVSLPEYGMRGLVIKANDRQIEVSTSDGFSVKAKPSQAKKIAKPEEKKPVLDVHRTIAKSVPLELNIIGYRAEEAKYAIESYLDSCRMASYKRVRIIHGMGGGILRKVTEDYLKKHGEFVASFEPGGAMDGGFGATIVNLK